MRSEIVVNKNVFSTELYTMLAKNSKSELYQGNATKTRKTTLVAKCYHNTMQVKTATTSIMILAVAAGGTIPWQCEMSL